MSSASTIPSSSSSSSSSLTTTTVTDLYFAYEPAPPTKKQKLAVPLPKVSTHANPSAMPKTAVTWESFLPREKKRGRNCDDVDEDIDNDENILLHRQLVKRRKVFHYTDNGIYNKKNNINASPFLEIQAYSLKHGGCN